MQKQVYCLFQYSVVRYLHVFCFSFQELTHINRFILYTTSHWKTFSGKSRLVTAQKLVKQIYRLQTWEWWFRFHLLCLTIIASFSFDIGITEKRIIFRAPDSLRNINFQSFHYLYLQINVELWSTNHLNWWLNKIVIIFAFTTCSVLLYNVTAIKCGRGRNVRSGGEIEREKGWQRLTEQRQETGDIKIQWE